MEQFRSGLARPMDVRRRDNVAALLITVLVFLAWSTAAWIGSEPWSDVLVDALVVAGATFLAWAIGRELDPEQPGVAVLAMLLVPAWLVIAAIGGADATPSLAAAFLAMAALRITVGTTGRDLGFPDVIFLALAAALTAPVPGGWIVLAMFAAGLLLGRAGGGRWSLRPPSLGLIAVAAGAGWLILHGRYEALESGTNTAELVMALAVLMATGVLVARIVGIPPRLDVLRSEMDEPIAVPSDRGTDIPAWRVVAGRVTALVAVVASPVAGGGVVTVLAPLWAAYAAVLAIGLAGAPPAMGGRRRRRRR